MEKIDLNKIYKRKKSDRDIFQELMPFKVKEILLIANYYDSYTIEREGQFSGKIFGEYLQLNLFTAPRFTSVANEEGALHELKNHHGRAGQRNSNSYQPSHKRAISRYLPTHAGQ